MLDPSTNSLADENGGPVFLVQALQAGCEIHGIAQSRIVHALFGAQISHHRISAMDAEPNNEAWQSLGLELGIECIACRLCRKGGATGALNVVDLWMGSIPKNHHGIPNELVHGPAFRQKRHRQHSEMP